MGRKNNASCVISYSIIHENDPAITCPNDLTVSASVMNCTADIEYVLESPRLSDDWIDASISTVIGDTTITYTATNQFGDTVTCSISVTIVDETKPIISCPQDITLHIRNLSLPPIESAWDNCGPINVSSVLNEQLTEAIYTATDASGNSAVCTASVTVLRNSLAIVCPEDINLTANSLDCDNTAITYPDAQVFNNSGSVTISTESDIDELFPIFQHVEE